MSLFKYNDETLTDDEMVAITVYLSTVKNVGHFAERLRTKLKLGCCDDCPMAILIKRGQIILDCLGKLPHKEDRVKIITRADERDIGFVAKFVVGHIDLEATMDGAQSIVEDGHTENTYLEFMNTLKHMYAVKQRYWE